jgi:hypothetical protein
MMTFIEPPTFDFKIIKFNELTDENKKYVFDNLMMFFVSYLNS